MGSPAHVAFWEGIASELEGTSWSSRSAFITNGSQVKPYQWLRKDLCSLGPGMTLEPLHLLRGFGWSFLDRRLWPQAAYPQQSSICCFFFLRQEIELYIWECFSTESEIVKQKILLNIVVQWDFYVNAPLPNFPEASLPLKLFLFLHHSIIFLRLLLS